MENSYYRLLYSVEPAHKEDEDFVDELAENIWFACESYLDLNKHPFVLKIGEYHCGRKEHTWEAEMQVGNIGGDNLVKLSAVQDYHAHNCANPAEDYDGKIQVTLTTIVEREVSDVPSWMEAIVLLVYAYYYKGIVINYDDWNTSYQNAPTFDAYRV